MVGSRDLERLVLVVALALAFVLTVAAALAVALWGDDASPDAGERRAQSPAAGRDGAAGGGDGLVLRGEVRDPDLLVAARY